MTTRYPARRLTIALCLMCSPGAHLAAANDDAPVPSESRAVTWEAEFRGRFEFPRSVDFTPGRDAHFYTHRVRVSAGFQPSPLVRIFVQGQDARAAGFTPEEGPDSLVHHLDFHQAFVDLGRPKEGWSVTAGRQALAFGDERLVGADDYWDPLGQTFDAVRLQYQSSGVRVEGFGALVVLPDGRRIARSSTAEQLFGVYASTNKGFRGASLEPYSFWKRHRPFGHNPDGADVTTFGLRTTGDLPARLDYNVEMALQAGYRSTEAIRAWMGHWELGLRPASGEKGPRLAAEYNHASGDRRPADDRDNTFDDLYPSGYNRYGLADPFAARNLRSISTGMDWRLNRRWLLGTGYRSFWLATVNDSLYIKGDEILTRNPQASSSHVGHQLSLFATWTVSGNWQVNTGYARFFPGPYLTDSSYRGQLSTPYVMLNYHFGK